jgi:putative DNA primase/helicase
MLIPQNVESHLVKQLPKEKLEELRSYAVNGEIVSNQHVELTELDANDRDLARLTNATLKVLIAANKPPFIFRHADCVSRIQESDDGSLVIRRLDEDSLRHILAREIQWYRKKSKKILPELPPKHVAKDILAMPAPPFPLLTRVVRAPIFARDGTLRTKPGYHTSTTTYYDPPARDFDISIPPKPTAEDVAFAREQIIDLLFDFPFVSEAERTHAITLLLQPFARELIDGPTPLYLIEKPSPGTGAGLLSDVVTGLFLGAAAPVMSEGRDEDEWRKRITAKLIQNNTIVLIDNIRRRLESSSLSAALTGGTWEDRVLGHTAMVRVPIRATWIATGNNPSLSNEMARRTIRIRMDPKVDRPWLREGFRHTNLRAYATKEKGKLIWSALVLIQHWIEKGRPACDQKPLGTFEAWSNIMGGIVESAGFQGFLGNLEELYEESDAEGKAWRSFVNAWWDEHGAQVVGVNDLFSIAAPVKGDPIQLDLGDKSERSQKIRLGKLLVQNRDRQFDGKRIVRGGTKDRAQQWRLQDVSG